MSSDDRRARWTPPEAQDDGAKGVLGGSRLFDQPKYRAELERFEAFVAGDAPLIVEIGFDHGFRLLSHAQAWPEQRWLGLEVRKARVEALAEKAPQNLLPWRVDARTVFGELMPPGRVHRVDVLFPTPWWDETKRKQRLLLTEPFVASLARALEPGGAVHVATDVGPYFDHVERLFVGWGATDAPPRTEQLTRREWSCQRDGLAVWRGTWRRP